jgi:hypothetical protein
MRSLLVTALATALSATLVAACGSDGGADAPSAAQGQLVVGLQTAELGNTVGSYHLVVKRDDVVQADKTYPLTLGASTAFAEAIEVDGAVASVVDVVVEGIPPTGGAPVLARHAIAKIAAGNKKLLRLRMDTHCLSFPGVNGGPSLGPSCAAPLTCAAGACVPPEVAEADLEDFVADWQNAPPPDACRPAKPGPPEVILGTGQTDYATLTDGQELQLEQGPQGGHHIWLAVRMKNLRQSGSTTTVTSTVVDGPMVLEPLAVVFTFDRDEGSYCKVYGLRYQVDVSGLASDGTSIPAPDYHAFLGKTMTVTAEVVDSTGARASSSRTIHLKDKILCADGTEACNTPP